MYVDPCCVENQLPRQIRQSGGHSVPFQTAGDVTLSHFMKGIMLMSGERPRTLTLCIPVLTAEVIRLLRRYMQLEWVSHLQLVTSATPSEHNAYALLREIGVPMDRITYAPVTDAQPLGLLMFAGDTHTIAIQGQIEPVPSHGLHLYTAIYGPSGSPNIRSFTDPITALIKARKVELAEPTAEGQSEVPAEAQPKADAQRKRRTKKSNQLRVVAETKPGL